VIATAVARNKKEAEQNASRLALEKLTTVKQAIKKSNV